MPPCRLPLTVNEHPPVICIVAVSSVPGSPWSTNRKVAVAACPLHTPVPLPWRTSKPAGGGWGLIPSLLHVAALRVVRWKVFLDQLT